MPAIVSLGHWLTSRFQSSLVNYAPGVAAGFSAWFAVRGGSGTQSTEVVYFGNSDGADTGWQFTRLADIAASTPQGRLVPIQIEVGDASPAVIVATGEIPLALWIGRIHLFGMTLSADRSELALWANGARLTDPSAFADALVPGASNLRFGVQSVDACKDTILAGAYSSYTGADLGEADLVHATIYDAFKRQTSGKTLFNALVLAEELTGITIPRETVYDAWTLRGPYLSTPPTLVNEGTDGAVGDQTFTGSDLLEPQLDQTPCYAGPLIVEGDAPEEDPFDSLTAWFRSDDNASSGGELPVLQYLVGRVGTEGFLLAFENPSFSVPAADPLMNNQFTTINEPGAQLDSVDTDFNPMPPAFWDFLGSGHWTGYIVYYTLDNNLQSLLTTSSDDLRLRSDPNAPETEFSLGVGGITGDIVLSYPGPIDELAQYSKIVIDEDAINQMLFANTLAGSDAIPFDNAPPGSVSAALQCVVATDNGQIALAEILLWNVTLTAGQQAQVEAYLLSRYTLALPP